MRECKVRKEVVDFHINETTTTDAAKPVDFSFFQYKEIKPVGCEKARISRLGQTPDKGKEKRKFLTKGLWLNNNKLATIKALDTLVDAVLETPEKLSWIDFSFNYITKIDDIILQFPNLRILNFHGNKISDITEVAKLSQLKKLRSITFHGNPIADQNNYRNIIIAFLPGIVHLDYQPVLKSERLEPLHPDSLKMMRALKQPQKPQATEATAEQPAVQEPVKESKPAEAPKPEAFAAPKPKPPPENHRKGRCACSLNRKFVHPVRLK